MDLKKFIIAICIAAVGLWCFFKYSKPRNGLLEGSIFIATKGGENFKLGAVKVLIFPSTFMDSVKSIDEQSYRDCESLQPRIDAKKSELEVLEKSYHEYKDSDAGKDDCTSMYAYAANVSPAKTATNPIAKSYWVANDELEELYLKLNSFRIPQYYFSKINSQPLLVTESDAEGKFQVELPLKDDYVLAASADRQIGDKTEKYYWLIKFSFNGAPKRSINLSNNNLTSAGSSESLIHTIVIPERRL